MKEFVFILQKNGEIETLGKRHDTDTNEANPRYQLAFIPRYIDYVMLMNMKDADVVFVSCEELEGFLEDVKKVQQCKHESAPVIDPLAPKGVTKGICWDCGKEVEVKEDKS